MWPGACAAERKLLVDGGWRSPACDGGILAESERTLCGLAPGTARMDPSGVVARWIRSAGGGDEGRGGGPSRTPFAAMRRSGMKFGGGMLLGGGGSFGGGGSDITGGLVLSIDAKMGPFVDVEGTRERVDASSAAALENRDSIDCLSAVAGLRPIEPPPEDDSRNTLDRGVFTGDGAVKTGAGTDVPKGGGTNWN